MVLDYTKYPGLPMHHSKSLNFQGIKNVVRPPIFRMCAPAAVYTSKIQISEKEN